MVHLIAVVGPTGVGKSAFAITLAKEVGGEILGADSRQVYRYMDIGTAKPTAGQRAAAPHHLIDLVAPNEHFSLALYKRLAEEAMKDVVGRGRIPLLVGGTGLYVWAVLEGWQIPEVPPDLDFRRSLEEKARREGSEILYAELQRVDPASSTRIAPKNVRRVIRALEINRHTGCPASSMYRKRPPTMSSLIIGLTMERAALYETIDHRVDRMIKDGLVEETKGLLDMGYGISLPAMSSIGYKEMGLYIRDELELDSAIQRTKNETHRFARRQYSWFRLSDRKIHWFDTTQSMSPALDLACAWVKKGRTTVEVY